MSSKMGTFPCVSFLSSFLVFREQDILNGTSDKEFVKRLSEIKSLKLMMHKYRNLLVMLKNVISL